MGGGGHKKNHTTESGGVKKEQWTSRGAAMHTGGGVGRAPHQTSPPWR